MILFFSSKVLFFIELCLFFGIFVAIFELSLGIFPHGVGKVIDRFLGKLALFLRFEVSHFLFPVHLEIGNLVMKHLIFPAILEDIISQNIDFVFEHIYF